MLLASTNTRLLGGSRAIKHEILMLGSPASCQLVTHPILFKLAWWR